MFYQLLIRSPAEWNPCIIGNARTKTPKACSCFEFKWSQASMNDLEVDNDGVGAFFLGNIDKPVID